jgi:hypothetical protein
MLYNIYPCCQQNDSIVREQTDIFEIAEILKQVAIHKKDKNEILNKKVETNYQWVKNLEWSNIAKMWTKYFKETF